MNNIEQHKNFFGDVDQIPKIRGWVVKQLIKFKITDESISDIKVAITEALTNIYRHSYNDEIAKPVRINIGINKQKLFIRLRHFGKKFDLKNYTTPDLSEPFENGYGIYMIKELMDSVQYITHHVGTELIMWKSTKNQ